MGFNLAEYRLLVEYEDMNEWDINEHMEFENKDYSRALNRIDRPKI